MKRVKFLAEQLGENSDTAKDIVDVWQGQADLNEETQCCLNYDDNRLVSVKRYAVVEIDLPDWMDSQVYAKSVSYQVKYKWFVGFGGNPEWGANWFHALDRLGEVERYASIKLLNVKTFRSEFRKSLREQLEKWLNGDSLHAQPFSAKQWDSVANRHVRLEADRASKSLYSQR